MAGKNITSEANGMKFLRKLREKKGWSQYRTAKELDMIQQTYIRLENSGEGCKMRTLVKLRKKLDLTWEELGKLIEQEFKD